MAHESFEDEETAAIMNEHFINYGPEDAELIYRFVKLGYPLTRIDGHIYHIDHIRVGYTWDQSINPHIKNNELEYQRIKSMDVNQLEKEVEKWKISNFGYFN